MKLIWSIFVLPYFGSKVERLLRTILAEHSLEFGCAVYGAVLSQVCGR